MSGRKENSLDNVEDMDIGLALPSIPQYRKMSWIARQATKDVVAHSVV